MMEIVTKDIRGRGIHGSRMQLRARRMGTLIDARAREIPLMDIIDCFTGSVLCMREVSP